MCRRVDVGGGRGRALLRVFVLLVLRSASSTFGSSGSQPAIESANVARIDPARRENFTAKTPIR